MICGSRPQDNQRLVYQFYASIIRCACILSASIDAPKDYSGATPLWVIPQFRQIGESQSLWPAAARRMHQRNL